MKIDPVINGFIPNEVKIHLHICDHLIMIFGIIGLFLGDSNTSNVGSLDRFRKSVFGDVKTDVCIVFDRKPFKRKNMKIQYANDFFTKLGMGYPTTCTFSFPEQYLLSSVKNWPLMVLSLTST